MFLDQLPVKLVCFISVLIETMNVEATIKCGGEFGMMLQNDRRGKSVTFWVDLKICVEI
jgi:hypothetical protein